MALGLHLTLVIQLGDKRFFWATKSRLTKNGYVVAVFIHVYYKNNKVIVQRLKHNTINCSTMGFCDYFVVKYL